MYEHITESNLDFEPLFQEFGEGLFPSCSACECIELHIRTFIGLGLSSVPGLGLYIVRTVMNANDHVS